jgi:hypothetical protein
MLICTARSLFSMFAAMIAPCSVKAKGSVRLPPRPFFDIAICDVKASCSSLVSRNRKSSGKRFRFRGRMYAQGIGMSTFRRALPLVAIDCVQLKRPSSCQRPAAMCSSNTHILMLKLNFPPTRGSFHHFDYYVDQRNDVKKAVYNYSCPGASCLLDHEDER